MYAEYELIFYKKKKNGSRKLYIKKKMTVIVNNGQV